MKTPSRYTLSAIISEINVGTDASEGRPHEHPMYRCMFDLMQMQEFKEFVGAFALSTFEEEITEEQIMIFGLSMFVTGLRVGRAEAIPMPEEYV